MRTLEYAVKAAAVSEDDAQYVLSDGEPDRLGDVIDPKGWVLSSFAPSALFNHNRDYVIGRWEDVKVQKGQLLGRLVLAEPGSSPLVDMVRALISQGMLDAVSVGFAAIEGEPLDPKAPYGAFKFTKSELLEASLVSVPANPRARRVVKQFFPDDVEAARLFAKPGALRVRSLPARNPGEPAAPHLSNGKSKMKLSDAIVARESEIVTLRDKISAIAKRVEDEGGDMSEDDATEAETLRATLKSSETTLGRLKALESDMMIRNDPNGGANGDDDDDEARTITTTYRPVPTEGIDQNGDSPIKKAARNARGYDLLVRSVLCAFYGYIERRSPFEIMKDRYGKHRQLRELEVVLKAATAPAMTNVVGWAAELVGANVQALMDTIRPVSIYPRIAARGVEITFDGQVPIVIPARLYGTGGASPADRNRRLAGAFVGQGQPIPVRQGLFTGLTLNPYKMGVISTFTREMANASTPAMETIIREAIAEDTAWTLDMALLSDEAGVAGVRPPGLFNGLTPIAPAAAGPDAALTDLKALVSAVIGAGGGRSVVLVMNPLQALGLSLMHEGGLFYFRDEISRGQLLSVSLVTSVTVPAGEVYCIDAADFASGTGAPVYDVSDQATLHMDDGSYPDNHTAPTVLPISATGTPNVVAAPVRSLWQTASIGIRMLMNVSWGMRRPGMVAYIVGVNW